MPIVAHLEDTKENPIMSEAAENVSTPASDSLDSLIQAVGALKVRAEGIAQGNGAVLGTRLPRGRDGPGHSGYLF